MEFLILLLSYITKRMIDNLKYFIHYNLFKISKVYFLKASWAIYKASVLINYLSFSWIYLFIIKISNFSNNFL